MLRAVLHFAVNTENVDAKELYALVKSAVKKNEFEYGKFVFNSSPFEAREGISEMTVKFSKDPRNDNAFSIAAQFWELSFLRDFQSNKIFSGFFELLFHIMEQNKLDVNDNDFFVALYPDVITMNIKQSSSTVLVKDWDKVYVDSTFNLDTYAVRTKSLHKQDAKLLCEIFSQKCWSSCVCVNEVNMEKALKKAKLSSCIQFDELALQNEKAEIKLYHRNVNYCFVSDKMKYSRKKEVFAAKVLFDCPVVCVREATPEEPKRCVFLGYAGEYFHPYDYLDHCVVEYTDFQVPLAEVLSVLKKEEMSLYEFMTETAEEKDIWFESRNCLKKEAEDFYLNFHDGIRPEILDIKDLTMDTPCGFYIIV